jgi:hypothetical protein
MYLATLQAVRFLTILKGDDSRKNSAMNPFKLYGTTARIIDDLNDIAVLVKSKLQYTSIDEVFKLMIFIISGYEDAPGNDA